MKIRNHFYIDCTGGLRTIGKIQRNINKVLRLIILSTQILFLGYIKFHGIGILGAVDHNTRSFYAENRDDMVFILRRKSFPYTYF